MLTESGKLNNTNFMYIALDISSNNLLVYNNLCVNTVMYDFMYSWYYHGLYCVIIILLVYYSVYKKKSIRAPWKTTYR